MEVKEKHFKQTQFPTNGRNLKEILKEGLQAEGK